MISNENNIINSIDENGEVSILVVEDSETQAVKLEYILEKANFLVQVANNGLEALEYLKNNRPSLIISDVMMPVMNGYDLCKKIKSDMSLKSIPIILLTQLSDPVDILRGLEVGVDNFITKPYKDEFLISRIHQLLVNVDLRKTGMANVGLEVVFKGNKYFLNSERIQILDLLLSSYESAVDQYIALEKANIEVKRLNVKLLETVRQVKELSLTDELTGLYNKRGFAILTEHEINIANRKKEKRTLLLIHLENMREINTNLGYQDGDQALKDTADILMKIFRKTEIIARADGGDFVIFFSDTSSDYVDKFLARIYNAIEQYNTSTNKNYRLYLSSGEAVYDPEKPGSVDELINIAGKKLYEGQVDKSW